MTDPLPPGESRSSDPAPPIAASREVAGPAWERATLERLLFESLKEQRQARRWRTAMRLAWLVLVLVIAWALLFRGQMAGVDKATPHTAVVEIKGEIASGEETSAEAVVSSLRTAFEDTGAQGIVLLINSPGGSPVQAGIIYDEIGRLRQQFKKPVYAVVEESCASAAYYIAAATDRIYVDKASIVGSIGVLMDGFGFSGLMDKLGIERRLLTAGENKGFLDPFKPMGERERAFAQQLLAQIHRQFIDAVKTGRGARLKETPELFTGLFWTGQQAIDMGLADHLGNVDFVAREVIKAEELVDYTRRSNVAERLAKRFGAAIGEGAVKALQVVPAVR